jgi:tRNA G10  N-methylase Trm11
MNNFSENKLYNIISNVVEMAAQEYSKELLSYAVAQFFEKWIFHESSSIENFKTPNSYGLSFFTGGIFILFSKNGGVTNLQYAELDALLGSNCYIEQLEHYSRPIIYNTKTYKEFVYNIFDSSISKGDFYTGARKTRKIKETAEYIYKTYSEHLRKSIIVDVFYTSCAIYMPPTVYVDLRSMVDGSGYIHSAGKLLYLRNLEKVSEINIVDEIIQATEYVPKTEGVREKVQLVPYADEYFEKWETGVTSTRNGLEDIRIKAKRHYIENISLEEFLLKISSNEKANIYVAPGLDNFKKERKLAVEKNNCTKGKTIWLILDHGCDYRSDIHYMVQEQSTYLICYEQYYINDYPLHVIKERKPGWVESITLPHTLSTALLNIASAGYGIYNRGDNQTLEVLDPFVGSGTVLLDSLLKWHSNVKFTGVDADEKAISAVKTNAEFISLSKIEILEFSEKLEIISEKLDEIKCEYLDDIERILSSSDDEASMLLSATLKKLAYNNENSSWEPSQLIRKLSDSMPSNLISKDASLFERCLIHTTWRALKLNAYTIRKNGEEYIKHSIIKEFRHVVKEYNSFSQAVHFDEDGAKKYGLYSESITKSHEELQFCWSQINCDNSDIKLIKGDAISQMRKKNKRSIDLIITDPPYGFNTFHETKSQLSDLYDKFFDEVIRILRPGGQLIMCLPTRPKTGRLIDFALTKSACVSNLLLKADREGRAVLRGCKSNIKKGNIVSPPYYWGGYSSIGRDILHFTLI